VRGIGQGMKVYSNDNQDWYPTALYKEPTSTGINDTAVSFVGNLSNGMTLQVNSPGVNSNAVHVSRSLFMLVTDGSCTTKQFICPSSGDSEDDLRNGTTNPVAAQPGINRFDFKGYPFLSYGGQIPFGAKAKPNENLDARMVILADKGPYFKPGAANGERTPDAAVNTSAYPIVISGAATEDAVLKLETDKWRPYNSRSHNMEGQNCLFQDGHALFEKKPIVGVNFDNIYTFQTDFTMLKALTGSTPYDLLGPYTQTDSVIVP
jgi:hypothetical protein